MDNPEATTGQTLPPTDAPPQWDAIDREILCPLCDYNLRGLVEPRCPECGYRSTWPELLDPWRIHPYIFEHHPKRNWWSYWKTAFNDLRPLRFWKLLQPQHMPKVRRLVIYWLINALAGLLIFATAQFIVFAVWEHSRYVNSLAAAARWWAIPPPPPPDFPSLAFFKFVWDRFDLTLPLWFAAVYNLWILGTLLTMRIFRISLRRARVNMVHVLRCIVYSFDGAPSMAILVWLPALALAISGEWGHGIMEEYIALLIAIAWLFAAFRFTVAQYRYLRFSHAWAVVLATQIIVALTFANLCVAINVIWQNCL